MYYGLSVRMNDGTHKRLLERATFKTTVDLMRLYRMIDGNCTFKVNMWRK